MATVHTISQSCRSVMSVRRRLTSSGRLEYLPRIASADEQGSREPELGFHAPLPCAVYRPAQCLNASGDAGAGDGEDIAARHARDYVTGYGAGGLRPHVID
jgi:hypothetical protein